MMRTTSLFSYANAKRCSNEGRALMQLDFQSLLRRLERIIEDMKYVSPHSHSCSSAWNRYQPFRPLPHKEFVENYIKAYYLPEQSIDQWIRDNTVTNGFHTFLSLYRAALLCSPRSTRRSSAWPWWR